LEGVFAADGAKAKDVLAFVDMHFDTHISVMPPHRHAFNAEAWTK
jgi:hypothetical protein